MTEEWRDIVGYEELYRISNHGRVMSNHVNRKGQGWQILEGYSDQKGYRRVGLRKDGKFTDSKIHRLVAKAFHENPLSKPEVNHKDGCKSNNRADNLEWATTKENSDHAFATGLNSGLPGESNGRAKMNTEEVARIRRLAAQGVSNSELLKSVSVNRATLNKIINRKLWNHEPAN